MLTSSVLVFGLCGFLTSFALSFQSQGLGQGLAIGAELERIRYGEGNNPFGYSVQNTHQHMAPDYWAISVSFTVIAILSAVQLLSGQVTKTVFPLVSIAPAAIVANFLRTLIRDKAGVEDSFYEAPRNHFVELTIAYDWFLLILTGAVVLCSLLLIVLNCRTKTDEAI